MRFTTTIAAEQFDRFAPECWDHQIGKEVPIHVGSERISATLVAAEVSQDGGESYLTLEVPQWSVHFDVTETRVE